MATTTPNFGWPVPTSTDLVKDGATAIEALGDGIDTSMVDLKGGTTGQVLAKTTNADMDFTWVTTDDANAIQNTIVDAKGDLIAASAADTPARLAVGANGETLVVDSSTSTGLRYQGSMAGGRNGCINGAFDVWQRGTSFSIPASTGAAYYADRFMISTAANQAITISRQATGDSTNLPFIQYCARLQRNSGQTGTTLLNFATTFETSNSIPFAGKAITVSFYARAGANFSAASSQIGITVVSGTGTDQNVYTGLAGTASIIASAATLTTTWQRFQFTGSVASTATQIALYTGFTPVGTAGANDYYEVTGIQLEQGSIATPFSRTGGSIQGETSACQRYFQKSYDITVNPGTSAANGYVYSNLLSVANNSPYLSNPIKSMRTAPTVTVYGYSGTAGTVSEASTGVDKAANTGQASAIGTEGFIVRNGNATTQTFTQGAIYQYTASAEL